MKTNIYFCTPKMNTNMNRVKIALLSFILIAFLVPTINAQNTAPPKPYGPLPTKGQLQWHETEMYGFIHFTINTFTNKEWGYGDEDPKLFNPTDFNADQIVSSIKAAGLKGVVLTCKHHDGFCLWPTKTTEHNISKSPWKNGKGDIVREISDACKRHGMKFGVYLSPWDRNNANYGKPEYIKIYRSQIRELLTNYGPVFEQWFDGANGGDGFYGGAREKRTIDKSTYYDWKNTWNIVRKLQPQAVIFGDVGPDVRWVGTEAGNSGNPCWATYTPHGVTDPNKPSNGDVLSDEGMNGHRNGKFWMPAEVDFSIRPGWFWHESENDKVKSSQDLLNHYFNSVGNGANMILNIPPDRRGLVYEKDVASLVGFGKLIKQMYAKNFATGAKVTASNTRGNASKYSPKLILDNDRYSYWATDDNITTANLVLQLKGKQRFNVLRIRENIKLGQRIDDWAVDVMENGNWKEYAKGSAIGSCRLVRGPFVTSDKVRIRITKASACPCISEVGIYAEPRN
jgi:alpha-L-fucosidase